MGRDAKTADWLTERLEEQRAAFTDTTYPLQCFQMVRWAKCESLLQEDEAVQTSGSPQRLWRRRRARKLLADVFTSFGCEVFVLCSLAASITDLASVEQPHIVPKLEQWWSRVHHPEGLSTVAKSACKLCSIEQHISRFRDTSVEPHERDENGVLRSDQYPMAKTSSDDWRTLIAIDRITESNPGRSMASLLTDRAENPTLLGNCSYSSFSFMSRKMTETLPEPFRRGLQTSTMWNKQQEQGGLAITNCLSMYMPEIANEDVVVLLRLGYGEGWKLFNELGLGEPPTLAPEQVNS